MPEASGGFAARVMRALPREPAGQGPELLEQLSRLFPRLAWAAVLVAALCAAVEVSYSLSEGADLASSVGQLSDQWLFTTKGF